MTYVTTRDVDLVKNIIAKYGKAKWNKYQSVTVKNCVLLSLKYV